MVGLAYRRHMLAGVGKKAVEQLLVLAAEGTPEVTEGLLFSENDLVGCL